MRERGGRGILQLVGAVDKGDNFLNELGELNDTLNDSLQVFSQAIFEAV